jgi:hypothetical protein
MSQKGKLINKEAGLGKAGRIYLQIGDKKISREIWIKLVEE